MLDTAQSMVMAPQLMQTLLMGLAMMAPRGLQNQQGDAFQVAMLKSMILVLFVLAQAAASLWVFYWAYQRFIYPDLVVPIFAIQNTLDQTNQLLGQLTTQARSIQEATADISASNMAISAQT